MQLYEMWKVKWMRWVLVLYVVGILVVIIPKIPSAVTSLVDEYKAAFFGDRPSRVSELPIDLAASVSEIQEKLSSIERDMASVRATGSSDELLAVETELAELKATIFGDPLVSPSRLLRVEGTKAA